MNSKKRKLNARARSVGAGPLCNPRQRRAGRVLIRSGRGQNWISKWGQVSMLIDKIRCCRRLPQNEGR